MISIKYALVIAVGAFAAGSFFASPLPQAIAAVIATDVQCTGCVGTPDLAGNAVTAAKIKDSEVKAAEIAPDAVGGSELIGVSKLLFGQCVADNTEGTTSVPAGDGLNIQCTINGVDIDDSAIVTAKSGQSCFDIERALTNTNTVNVQLRNDCTSTQSFGVGSEIGIIVFDK
jgi:hypothetical protein